MTFYFSRQNDPNKWTTSGGSVWVGHPAIARGIIRLLNWLKRFGL